MKGDIGTARIEGDKAPEIARWKWLFGSAFSENRVTAQTSAQNVHFKRRFDHRLFSQRSPIVGWKATELQREQEKLKIEERQLQRELIP